MQQLRPLAQKEDRAVWYLRILCFSLLSAFALVVISTAYNKGVERAKEAFDQVFFLSADNLITSIDRVVNDRLGQIQHFANEITSHAAYVEQQMNETWPMVTLPDFEIRATERAQLSDLFSINVFIKIVPETSDAFVAYAHETMGWINESIAYNSGVSIDNLNFTFELPNGLYALNQSSVEHLPVNWDHGYGYFSWQSYPMRKQASLLCEIERGGLDGAATDHVVQTHEPAIAASFDFWDPRLNPTPDEVRRREDLNAQFQFYDRLEYGGDPVVNAYYPVFNKLYGDANREVVAILMVGVYWRSYFANNFAPGTPPMYVVMENTCNQTYTYVVDGSSASFIGHGDLHVHICSSKEVSYNITGPFGGDSSSKSTGGCQYTIHVYPTKEMENFYMTNEPLTFALSLASVFLLTSIAFILYDLCVGKRQAKVLKSANQSGTLVQNLFPEDVRNRLYLEQEAKNTVANQNASWTKRGKVAEVDMSSAIATLYSECSILFADLKGFTTWSAKRAPSQVFQLLETIYGAFDTAARKRNVFKIETIGDCYVAATGIPHAQPDHATIMVQFASDMIAKFRELISSDLAGRLGSDTRDLELRVGIHSGPVTAGVLRGDKGRFQVFGDTVNVASRLESNGEGGRIQLSEDTAKLLISDNCGHWLTKRLDLIEAKGKGKLQCYWANVVVHTETVSTAGGSSTDERYFR